VTLTTDTFQELKRDLLEKAVGMKFKEIADVRPTLVLLVGTERYSLI
jgi:hypothetical protein